MAAIDKHSLIVINLETDHPAGEAIGLYAFIYEDIVYYFRFSDGKASSAPYDCVETVRLMDWLDDGHTLPMATFLPETSYHKV